MEKIELNNGLTIAFIEQEGCHSAAISIYVGCGSMYETEDKMGVSHFIEHMLFKGTKNRTAAVLAAESDLLGGQLNAYTSKDHTCYHSRALSDRVPYMLEIMLDMLQNPLFDKKDMELERGVISEEISMYEDSPEELCADLLSEHIYKGPLGFNILGTQDTVQSLSVEDLLYFMSRFYIPSNIVIAICGKFCRSEILETVCKFFMVQKESRPQLNEEYEFNGGIVTCNRDFEQTQICIAFNGISLGDEDRYALAIFSNILGGSSSSRLCRKIREELGLAYSVYSFHSSYPKAGIFGISAATAPANEEQLLDTTFTIVKEIVESITQEEIERTKEQFKAGLVMGMESVSGLSSSLGRQLLIDGTYQSVEETIIEVDSVKIEDVKRIGKRVMSIRNAAICAVGKPKEEKFYKNMIVKYC